MTPFTDEYFMKKAIAQAHLAFDSEEIPVGCVITCDNKIIAQTHNLTETLTDVTAHAEIQAITAASNTLGGKYLNECVVYITLEPCTMCAGALAWAQIGKIVYGAQDQKRGYSILAPSVLHPKTNVVSGVMQEECAQLIKDFFASKR